MFTHNFDAEQPRNDHLEPSAFIGPLYKGAPPHILARQKW